MTKGAEMRKPDGYVHPKWRQLKTDDSVSVYKSIEKGVNFTPVCLVSPKLLDWVENAKVSFQNTLANFEDGFAKEMLIELEQIELEES